MKVYLILDLIVILGPLLFSFEPRIRYCTRWPQLFPAIFFVGSMFFFWDVLATARGDWGFNPEYLVGTRLAGVPIEEVLFFIAVPFSCIFIYEVVRYFLQDKIIGISNWFFYLVAGALVSGAFAFRAQGYTSTVLALCGLSVLTTVVAKPRVLCSKNYWIFILITFVPFMLMNSTLTSAPVVTYSPQAIWGVRIATVPLEDFFYSYALLSLNFLVYTVLLDQANQREKIKNLRHELSKTRRVL